MFYAHSTGRQDRSDWQPLAEHLHAVGRRAKARAAKFEASHIALLAGLAHDLGKYSPPFQRRIAGSSERVDHSTAGAREVMAKSRFGSGLERGIAELVAYIIAGHHAGLPDRHGGETSLTERLTKTSIPDLDPAWSAEVALPSPGGFPPGFQFEPGRQAFQISFLGRMIFSALIDADRRDTEDHAARTGGFAQPRDWPSLKDRVDDLIKSLDRHLAGLAKEGEGSGLNLLRADILKRVTARAEDGRGLYTLTVPTGGGKTLTVTRFALGHARRWKLDRIVYAIPFTSVIDQVASVLRPLVGDDLLLEHHSAIEFASAKDEEKFVRTDDTLERKLRAAMEDWAAPIVVTTNVQLFESLFSHRPSRCRKLHNLANSVIVLDEAQTIPLNLLRPCLAALDELARNYGCTIVLCTATQPAVAKPDFVGGLKLGPEQELAPDPAALHRALRRATIRMWPDPMTDDDLVSSLGAVGSGFVIVNSRRHALELFRRAKNAGLDGLVHLSTRQYAAHRKEILARIKDELRVGRPCRLIATSLIEAGIDLDFRAGWRATAGLENLVQAAGRVNREGRWAAEESILTVFRPADESHAPPPEIRRNAEAVQRIPARVRDDLASPAALQAYFRDVYWQAGADLDRIEVRDDSGTRAASVLGCFKVDATETNFAYRTVGENFSLIADGTVPVIVVRDAKALRALDRLRGENASAGAVARELQPYTVQLHPRHRARMVAAGDVKFAHEARFGNQFAVLVTSVLYSEAEGLLWEEDAKLGTEATIV